MRDISAKKSEPAWMLEQRLKGLRIFEKKPMPLWGADLSGIDFDNIKYFVRPRPRSRPTAGTTCPTTSATPTTSSASPKRRSNGSSRVSLRSMRAKSSTTRFAKTSKPQGVLFLDTDTGLREHEDLFREYFGYRRFLLATTSSRL